MKQRQQESILDYRLSDGKRLRDYVNVVDPAKFRVLKRLAALRALLERMETVNGGPFSLR